MGVRHESSRLLRSGDIGLRSGRNRPGSRQPDPRGELLPRSAARISSSATVGNRAAIRRGIIVTSLWARGALGSEVIGFALGNRVTLATTLACGACPYCDLA